MIMIYAIFWSFGLNGIPWIVSAETFPGALRNFSGTWAALVQWATQFPMSKCLPYMFNSFGYGTWFIFAGFMVVATVWSYFLLPETKGLTIDQMDMILYVLILLLYLPLTDNYTGYNQPGHRGIPHTRVTQTQLAALNANVPDKPGQTEHFETV